MSTYIDVHDPDPPEPGIVHQSSRNGGEWWTVFGVDRVQVYVHDPGWFDRVALWASREALKLREAQTAVEVCIRCDGGDPFVLTPGGERLCARCAVAEVA